jgi:hypothetical protein
MPDKEKSISGKQFSLELSDILKNLGEASEIVHKESYERIDWDLFKRKL